MRLWHKDMIPILPTAQLRGQWRECCLIAKALHDGNLNHILVNRVKDYPIEHLLRYGELVQIEMLKRGFKADLGKFVPYLQETSCDFGVIVPYKSIFDGWHNDCYLRECLFNLEEKALCKGVPADEWQKIYDVYGERFDLWNGKDKN